jgi:uncharacterized protein YjbI with pentapeptide repeats
MDDAKRLERLKGYFFAGRNYERLDLRNKDLRGINFSNCNFRAADLSGSDLSGASFVMADFSRANLHNCNVEGANFSGADMTASYQKGATYTKTILWHTVFKRACLKNVMFFECELVGADFLGAECLGARFDGSDVTGMRNVDRAIFRWFLNPTLWGKPVYNPYPGARPLIESALGKISFQENAGLGQTGLEYDRER